MVRPAARSWLTACSRRSRERMSAGMGQHGVAQLAGGYGGGAALHYDQSSREVRQSRRLFEGRAGGKRQGHRRDDRVSCPGDIGDLVRPVDRNVKGLLIALE